jgi:hypothetical protein
MNKHSRVILALAAPVAAGLILSSCGGQKTASTTAASSQGSVAEAAEIPHTDAVTTSATPGQPQAVGTDSTKQLSIDALPPDIVVNPVDSAVTRGQAVEITVEGTPDVTEMSLSDGLNDAQAFYYDSNDKVWKAVYRVPLRPKSERLGLSVTARTDANRWRRVWVFLNVNDESQAKAEGH